MDILFKNVTAVSMQADNPVLYNANVGITGSKITMVKDSGINAKRVVDGTGKLLMPGLYNCHTHAAMTMFRGLAGDLALEDWLFNHIFPAEKKLTPHIVYTGTLLAIAEMVASGTISFTDMYFNMDEVAKAAYESGVMTNLSNAVVTLGNDNYDYYKSNEYKQTIGVMETYAGDGRIKVDASIHGVYTSDEKAWGQVLEFAKKHDLSIHLHLSETKTEHENCIKKHGMTPAGVFHKNNVFSAQITAAHAVWVSQEDMDILAAHGAAVSHCPVSNLKLASGVAPVKEMLAKCINVALGTDGMASNNSHDLFEEIKIASITQKCHCQDPTALPAFDALKMATVNGAASQGRGHESGIIAEGYDADLVLIDLNNPRQTPCYDPLANLAYSTSGRDVAMTMCKGKILYENGEHKTIDIEKVLRETREIMKVFA